MAQRLDLGALLKDILGSNKVYFQPPSQHRIEYPCIIYERTGITSRSADNAPYKLENEYKITVIDSDPDSLIPGKVSKLPRCVHDRAFKTEQLNHDVFKIIF